MDTFPSQFESMLAKEKEAADLLSKAVTGGATREDIILLLGWATSRSVGRRFRKSYEKVKSLLPSRKKTLGLAARMERLALELEEVFGHPIYTAHPKSKRLTDIANLLQTEAATVRKFPQPRMRKLFSYDSFWRHVPIAMFCRLLDVPRGYSYGDAEKLLWYAFLARGIEQDAADRGLERELRRFEQGPGGDLLSWMLVYPSPKNSRAAKWCYPLFRKIAVRRDKYARWARTLD